MPEETPKHLTADAVQAMRDERKRRANPTADAQRATDLLAVDDLEQKHGDSNVAVVHVPYAAGLPTCAAVRTPSANEVSRYRFQCRPNKKGEMPDAISPAEDVADQCLLYPAADVCARLCAARPGLKLQLGLEALKLAQGASEADLKD